MNIVGISILKKISLEGGVPPKKKTEKNATKSFLLTFNPVISRIKSPIFVKKEGALKMNIVVCVKQVPGTSNVEVDPVTGVLKRDGVAGKLNPYDLFALETAFRIKEKNNATVSTISMGPNQAIPTLLETIYMGADHSYLISDRKFAGSDVHATSYAISQGIGKIGNYDLIICGKQTTDGDTAQVGPETAEWLGIEHVTNVISVDNVTEDSVTVTFNLDDCFQKQTMKLPCLITIDKDAVTPRLPSYKRKKAIEKQEDVVTVYTAADLDGLDENKCGLKGSPTQVERIFPPEKNTDKTIHEGSGEQLSKELFSILKNGKYI